MGKVSEARIEGQLRVLGFSGDAKLACSSACGSTYHCKHDAQLRSAAVKYTISVGPEVDSGDSGPDLGQ